MMANTRHVIGDREGCERAARDEQLLADFDDLNELGGVGVEINMFPASSPLACRCSWRRRHGLRQRWGVIRASPVMATSLPLACSRL